MVLAYKVKVLTCVLHKVWLPDCLYSSHKKNFINKEQNSMMQSISYSNTMTNDYRDTQSIISLLR